MANNEGKKKGKKGLVIGLIVFLLLAAGGVVGTAFVGILKIPGITPKKLLAKNSKLYGESKDKKPAKVAIIPTPKVIVKKEKPKPKPQPTTKFDPIVGAQRVADVWSLMDTTKLVEVAKSWKDADLARVIVQMDETKAAELLTLFDPKKASEISAEIAKQQSQVKI